MTESSVAVYALLIGIDYYEPNQLYKSLKGAVRDINLVEAFLARTLNIPDQHIYKLGKVIATHQQRPPGATTWRSCLRLRT